MAKTKKINKAISLPIIALILIAGVIMLAKQKTKMLTSPSPLPTIFQNQPIEIPANWKIKNEKFNDFSLSYKYPPDWNIIYSSGAGYPNYATISSSEREQCIGFTVSEDYKDIDREIAYIVTYSANGSVETKLPTNSIISSQDINVDGKQGKIVSVNYKNKEFLVAVLDLNINKGQRTFFAGLNTCSLKEKQTFYNILNSIKLK